jgi:CBS domain containing-hemolysin-like protein
MKSKRVKGNRAKDKKKKGFFRSWTFKVIIVSLLTTAIFSTLSEAVFSVSGIAVMVAALLFLAALGIIFDAVSVAVTACEPGPLTAMASRKVRAAKTAVKLVNNAEKVSSFCGDVIGDVVGIVVGSCVAAIAARASAGSVGGGELLTVVVSAVTAAVIIGGKAEIKKFAIKNAKKVVMAAARVVCFFKREG